METNIYKVVTSDGHGVFMSGLMWKFFDMYQGKQEYPSPHRDSLLACDMDDEEVCCACSDLNQLRHWFMHEQVITELAEDGALVIVLSVDNRDIRRGEFQVLYRHSQATKIKEYPIEKLPFLVDE